MRKSDDAELYFLLLFLKIFLSKRYILINKIICLLIYNIYSILCYIDIFVINKLLNFPLLICQKNFRNILRKYLKFNNFLVVEHMVMFGK